MVTLPPSESYYISNEDTISIFDKISKLHLKYDNKVNKAPSKSQVFMFFSFDLSNSTAFKAEHPALWASVFTNFYSTILENLGVESYSSNVYSGNDDTTCIKRLWKFIGDEVLIYIPIINLNQIYTLINSTNKILSNVINEIAIKVKEAVSCSSLDQHCYHCQDVEDVIKSSLGIKTTAWIAECYESENLSASNASNVIYKPVTQYSDEHNTRIDFLGKEIDEGFRLAKYAVNNKIIISPLLAWLIWKNSIDNPDMRKIIDLNFKIISFVEMKGIWKGRKVPIVLFYPHFEKFFDVLEYDELELISYSNIKKAGIEEFIKDNNYRVGRINQIFENVHKLKNAEELYQKLLKDENNFEYIPKSATAETKKEFHISCIIFQDNGNKILLHSDIHEGLSFGYIENSLDVAENWKNLCENGYRQKYGITISVDDNPTPIATYYDKKKEVFGLLLLANFTGNAEEVSKLKNWDIYDPKKLPGNRKQKNGYLKACIANAIKIKNKSFK